MQHLAVSSYTNRAEKETKSLSYSDLANSAEENDTFQFLTGETKSQPDMQGLSISCNVGHY